MKLSLATLVLAFATTEAFAPAKMHNNAQQTALFAEENRDFLPKFDGKEVASLVAASVLAFSTVGVTTTALPSFVEPAYAAKVEQVKEAPKKDAKEAPKKAAKEAPKKAAKKVEEKKLSGEEKAYNKAKANAEQAKKSLKSFEQLSSDAKSANKKAVGALDNASKAATSAKKAYTTVNDKLNLAKKQKMPSSAIKELSADAGTKKILSIISSQT